MIMKCFCVRRRFGWNEHTALAASSLSTQQEAMYTTADVIKLWNAVTFPDTLGILKALASTQTNFNSSDEGGRRYSVVKWEWGGRSSFAQSASEFSV